MKKPEVHLTLTPEVFLVVYEFLFNTRLGNTSTFETAVSSYMAEADEEMEDMADRLSFTYGTPSLGAQFSESDGLVFTVT